MFATGGADKKIKLFDARTGHILQSLSGALQTITSVSFNSTDEMILGSCTDNATRIWSLSTHRLKVIIIYLGEGEGGRFFLYSQGFC